MPQIIETVLKWIPWSGFKFFLHNIYLLIFMYLFILAAPDHGIFVAACGLLVAACMWDLVPWPGIEPGPPALAAQGLTHWTTREVPLHNILYLGLFVSCLSKECEFFSSGTLSYFTLYLPGCVFSPIPASRSVRTMCLLKFLIDYRLHEPYKFAL